MAYNCPRCGEVVERSSSSGAAVVGGLVGSLIYSAFGAFECPSCGKIPRKEFPPEARRKMVLSSVLMVVGAIVLLIVVLLLVYNLG